MVTKNWRECVYVDEQGLKSLRFAPSCEQAREGLFLGIIWQQYINLPPEQLVTFSNYCFEHGITKCTDSKKGNVYDTLYKGLRHCGYSHENARTTGTALVQQLRKDS